MYVYLIQSVSHPSQRYIGITRDFRKRLERHNAGTTPFTSKFRPWEPITVIWFSDRAKARAFEKYLKVGSGHAFANRHFW